jgi:protein CpxP
MSLPLPNQSFVRVATVAALLGATSLASPSARADSVTAPAQFAQMNQANPAANATAREATSSQPETVEQRITNLHATLKITPDEESKWNSVAQAMRENAANMEKLVATKRSQAPQSMTAVDDLKTYQEFAQAHVDGLKNLTSAFSSLYSSMPDQQKKNADQVFQNFGHENAPPSRS